MKKRLLPLVFILLLLSVTVTTLLGAPVALGENILHNLGHPTTMAANLEAYLSTNLSIKEPLRRLNLALRTTAGPVQLDNIFLAGDGLISRFIPTEDTTVHRRNTREILAFAQRTEAPVAVLLLPTASAIYQEQLPAYAAQIQFNQHGFIEETNKIFSGKAMAIDVYPALFGARKEYLYYRTDSGLTSRGGFLVYQALAKRLGLSPKKEADFRQQFLQSPYYGELYRQWGYGGVRGDTIVLYHYTPDAAAFQVRHWMRYENKTYYTLYPTQATVSGSTLDAVLGGQSPRIEIQNIRLPASAGSLLVLGDRNAMSFLPFLALHYQSITFADPSLLTESELASLNPSHYSQVLFSFSLESYMNTLQPTRAAAVGKGD